MFSRTIFSLFYNTSLAHPVQLPSELGLLKSLVKFVASRNSLTGLLPDFTEMEGLISLELQDNLFVGPISSELGTMENLSYVFLQDNQLTGAFSIPQLEEAPSSLRLWNVSGNLLQSNHSQTDLCWANETFFKVECSTLSPWETSLACGCSCKCL